MKFLRSLLVMFCMAAGIVSYSQTPQNTITATEAHVTISGATSREQLFQLRQQLLAQGIDFEYSPQFDNERHLISIEFTVKANNGQLVGTGANKNLQNPNAKVTFHVNKTSNTYNVEVVGDKK